MDRSDSIDFAKKYTEDLLSFFGLNTGVTARCEENEEVIQVSIPSTRLNGFLIGQRGETLRSVQFLLSTTLRNKEAELSRVNIDVANYKRHRSEQVADRAHEWCRQVQKTGETMDLKPMNAVDRRTVHQVVQEYGQLESHSEGEGRDRHLIISKKTSEEI